MRRKNVDWSLPSGNSFEVANLAVLMDIRDELQHLNRTLDCPNFQAIPSKLEAIRLNTRKPKRRKAKKP